MIGWLIIVFICALFTALCIWLHYRAGTSYGSSNDTGWGAIGVLMAIVTVVLAITVATSPIGVRMSIGEFQSQKTYIESHVSKDPLEDATITNKKIEMNSWLFVAQQSQKNYGIFTFYPDSIWNLKPIQ